MAVNKREIPGGFVIVTADISTDEGMEEYLKEREKLKPLTDEEMQQVIEALNPEEEESE